ncbi:Zinc finger, RING/FYVE/PHD-type [Plasmopara halstedii]|uniref:Zinc finger, RING/FYVE/PHD-type n=1 Tax=Plasmopara halstedii TaxID=4781 RepID=A0A0P1AQA7_PLAHL|nr:Zinc finger, RING/FYVE/PHD-type [Plasmopara halstedii]CEG43714.1 Zinc finger, RING/FYVE/PHD-type [Plasmopara halstedii]|eukprot:XP_024580083.1 Zinc finger, RING/FYVE/PHD-type [Plasmopara halstedii]
MFPLPLNFFPSLRLTKEEAQSFLQWGNSILQQTIDAYHREQFDTQEIRERKWKPIKQRHNLTVYRRREIKGNSEYRYLCTGRIDGTLDEVVMGRYADNTPDFRRISGVYREDIVDCAVLGVIKKRSPSDPFFLSCFKWMTVESPGKGLVKNRDVCWYEQIGMTRDHNGKEIGYTLTESVDLPTCPQFQECIRAKLSVCYLYKRNKSGGVNVYMRGKNDAGGKVLDWVADIKSAELWLRIEQAMLVAHAVIASALVEAGKHTTRPFTDNNKCELCLTKASGFFISSKECAACHRTTCSSCVSKVRVLSSDDFRLPQYEHFCKNCIRLCHQIDLRAPESIENLVKYAAASLTEMEIFKNRTRSSARTRAITNKSGDGEDYESRLAMTASRSLSSSGGSTRTLPQPLIGVKRNVI